MEQLNPPLVWSDFSAMATWMAEEIGGNYFMDKKSYKNPPPNAPYNFLYREPIPLCHEEVTILAIFIKRIFWEYWLTSKTRGFKPYEILRGITCKLGMDGYERGRTLYTACWQFTEKFPDLLKMIDGGDS